MSTPDVLIYHGKIAKVHYPYVDVLCGNQLYIEGEEVEVLAMASEVKVECVHDDAVNKCKVLTLQ